jgi:hypothetical protein
MKDHDMIVRLRGLRQLREQRAKETVMRRHTAARRATMLTQEASSAVAAHLKDTAAKERLAFGSLVGQAVSPASLHRIQGRFERTAEETARLQENEKTAIAAEKERKVELSDARDTHRKRLKDISKLDRLLEHLTTRTARRRMALAELSDEENRGPTHVPKAR